MKRGLILFLVIIPVTLGALTMERGNLKIVADENTGGFLLYGRLSQDADWIPLLVESYTSSYLELSLNGNKSILNGNRNYDIRLEQKEKELVIIFDGPLVSVEDHFTFVEPQGGIPYLILSTLIINTSGDTVVSGLKRVLDTIYLSDNTHFFLPDGIIDREALYLRERIPSPVLSQGKNLGETLYVDPLYSGKNPPHRLLAANWNRIDLKDWDYIPDEDTNFNSLPFSINDSALALYWDLGALSSGNSMETYLALGNRNFAGQTESPTKSAIDLIKEEWPPVAQPSVKKELSLLHVEEQLEYLDILVKDIDRLLKKGQDVTNDEILTTESRLEILEQKKRDYEEIQ